MLKEGPAKKVVIYLSEGQHYHHSSASQAALDFLFHHGVAGATVIRGVAGFGAEHHMHTADLLRLSEHLPIKVEFIETEAKLAELLPKLRDIANTGLIEVHDTTVVKAPLSAERKAPPPPAPPHLRMVGTAKLMRIYIGESDRWHDRPLVEALVQSLREHDIAGVTVYRGILGYGADGRLHRERPLGHDRPVMLSIVDSEDKLRAYLPLLEGMITGGLVVLSDVEVIKYSHAQPSDPLRETQA